jgi:hypothetical protein
MPPKELPKPALTVAKAASPAKAALGAKKPARATPPSGRKSRAQILSSEKKRQYGWYIRSTLLEGGFELILITKNNFNEDAYVNNLVVGFAPKDGRQPPSVIQEAGLLGAFRMRVSLDNPSPLLSGTSLYCRKAFLRLIETREDSEDHSRLAALNSIRSFFKEPAQNKYNCPVIIENPGWDLTPPGDAPLPRLDHYLQYEEIIKIIHLTHDNVNANWAALPENSEAVFSYFTKGHIPFAAHKDIGVSLSDVIVPETHYDHNITN